MYNSKILIRAHIGSMGANNNPVVKTKLKEIYWSCTSVVPSVRASVRVTEAPASVTGTEATEVREPKTRKKDFFFL
jgi:hypothetical protein